MPVRIIPRVDIKGTNVIKGIQMDGLRVIGSPSTIISAYYQQGADEIAFFDVVASLYGRNNLTELVSNVATASFIPLTVTGGIRSLTDARKVISKGADKIGINTAAILSPSIVTDVAKVFGNQASVLSIEARQTGVNQWEAFTESGREPSGVDAIGWAAQAESIGAGEISLTSVDRDGTLKGPDLELIRAVRNATNLPLVVGGGIGKLDHVIKAAACGADGIMIGIALHRNLLSIHSCKSSLISSGFEVRNIEQ